MWGSKLMASLRVSSLKKPLRRGYIQILTTTTKVCSSTITRFLVIRRKNAGPKTYFQPGCQLLLGFHKKRSRSPQSKSPVEFNAVYQFKGLSCQKR